MPSVERTFRVQPPPAQVIEYLADFSHATEWDPGTDSCTQVTDGSVEVGTRWHNESTVFGVSTELEYELTELRDDGVVLVGRNDTVTSTDNIRVVPSDGGSEVTYSVDLELQGAAKLAAPLAKAGFEKIAHDTERQMIEVLNRLPVT